jgi:predicted phage terminase large subunit-like protein
MEKSISKKKNSLKFSDYTLSVIQEYKSRLAAENSFYEFARQSWSQIEGGELFVDGWHIKAVCEHLEAAARRDILRLMVLLPPRCMKSTLISVMFPAWIWINSPEEQFIYASNTQNLANRDSVRCRRLIKSEWYQLRWGDRFDLMADQDTKTRFENDKKGYRIAVSVEGRVTGEGGSILVIDDPNDAQEVMSQLKRDGTNSWWSQVYSQRVKNRKKTVQILAMQRLDEMDLAGYIMSLDKKSYWTKLILPMEFEVKRKSKTIILPSTGGKIWCDPRTKEGQLLWPEHLGNEQIEEMKMELRNSYSISGQLQLSPHPAEGGILKAHWFSWWKNPKPPKILQIIQSWDTALKTKEENSYTACTTWGYFYDEDKIPCIILLNLLRIRIEYPELRQLIKDLYHDYMNDGTIEITPSLKSNRHVDMLWIEDKSTGGPLIQDLRRSGINARTFDPGKYGDKVQRVKVASSYIQEGQVFVPAMPPGYKMLRQYAQTLVELCKQFSSTSESDVVDTMTQVILKLADMGMFYHRKDPAYLREKKRSKAPLKLYDAEAMVE